MDIQLNFYWPRPLHPSDILAQKNQAYLKVHPEPDYLAYMQFLLALISENDFIVISYGSNEWDYLQFTRHYGNLVLSFPWSVALGRRSRQRDLLQALLLNLGFCPKTNWWLQGYEDKSLFFYDQIIAKNSPELIISFGRHRELLAAHLTLAIITGIFRLDQSVDYEVRLGSWKD